MTSEEESKDIHCSQNSDPNYIYKGSEKSPLLSLYHGCNSPVPIYRRHFFYKNVSAPTRKPQNESCSTLRFVVKFEICWSKKRDWVDKVEVRIEVRVGSVDDSFQHWRVCKHSLHFVTFFPAKFPSTLDFPTIDIPLLSRNFLTSHVQHREMVSLHEGICNRAGV